LRQQPSRRVSLGSNFINNEVLPAVQTPSISQPPSTSQPASTAQPTSTSSFQWGRSKRRRSTKKRKRRRRLRSKRLF
jgi:hypothetical protein